MLLKHTDLVDISEITKPVRLARSVYRKDNSTLLAAGVLLYPSQLKWLRRENIQKIHVEVERQPFWIDPEISNEILELLAQLESDEEIGAQFKQTLNDIEASHDRIKLVPSIKGQKIPLKDVETGMSLASMVVSGNDIAIESGTSLQACHIEYLKSNGFDSIEIIVPPPIMTKSEIQEQGYRKIVEFDGDKKAIPEIASAILLFEGSTDGRLVEPLAFMITSKVPRLEDVALVTLVSMPIMRARERVLDIFIQSEEQLRSTIKGMWLDSNNHLALLTLMLTSIPRYKQEDKAELIDFMAELPGKVVEKAVRDMLYMGSRDVQIYAYAVLNKLQSMDIIREKKGIEVSGREKFDELEAALNGRSGLVEKVAEITEILTADASTVFAYKPGSGNTEELEAALKRLGDMKSAKAIGPLSHAAEYFETPLRVLALKSVLQLRSPAQFEVMFRSLEHDDEDTLNIARSFFEGRKDAYTASVLLRRCCKVEKAIRHRIYSLLAGFPDKIIRGVLKSMKKGDPDSAQALSDELKEYSRQNRWLHKVTSPDSNQVVAEKQAIADEQANAEISGEQS